MESNESGAHSVCLFHRRPMICSVKARQGRAGGCGKYIFKESDEIMSLMGLGHDVVDISGFSQQLNEPGARLRALFSMRELRQAALRARMKHDDESLHLAARWAGKEAVLKAWCEAIAQLPRHTNAGEGSARAGEYPYMLDDFPWREVEILDDSRGCPRVVLSAKASTALTDSLGVNEPGPGQNRMPVFHVSLSHDGSVASAVVVLQMEDRPETDGI